MSVDGRGPEVVGAENIFERDLRLREEYKKLGVEEVVSGLIAVDPGFQRHIDLVMGYWSELADPEGMVKHDLMNFSVNTRQPWFEGCEPEVKKEIIETWHRSLEEHYRELDAEEARWKASVEAPVPGMINIGEVESKLASRRPGWTVGEFVETLKK